MNIKNKQIKAIKKKGGGWGGRRGKKKIVAMLQSFVGTAVPQHCGGDFLFNKPVRFYESSSNCSVTTKALFE